jgi:predicted RNase H-like HicB family nuclease
MRLAGLAAKGAGPDDTAAVEQALLAHLCRCTGWRTILEAWALCTGESAGDGVAGPARDLTAAGERATIEGRSRQRVAPDVALGHGGFADDSAPPGALVAVPDPSGGWAVGESLAEARAAAGKVQGRRTTAEVRHPLAVPEGNWAATLRTTWVEPAYLELDASWCAPGGEPATPLANGGAFGGKVGSIAPAAARALADEHGRAVRVVLAREDAVLLGPKRPPVAGGMAADGSGVLRVVAVPALAGDVATAVARVAPGLRVEAAEVPGPPTSVDPRAAGWAEALALSAAAGVIVPDAGGAPGVLAAEVEDGQARVTLRSPDGALATADVTLGAAARVGVRVSCGEVLDEVALRSYCVGAAHMALGWVTNEGLAVDETGAAHDLTIRSFGVLRAVDTPPIEVTVDHTAQGPAVNGSDAVFAAVAAATWLAQGAPPMWPTGVGVR